jgi:hypothetical protein
MKVITKGLEIEDWSTQLLCAGGVGRLGCGAVLEITTDDIGQISWHSGDDAYGFVTCPLCDAMIQVTPPIGILQRLAAKRQMTR